MSLKNSKVRLSIAACLLFWGLPALAQQPNLKGLTLPTVKTQKPKTPMPQPPQTRSQSKNTNSDKGQSRSAPRISIPSKRTINLVPGVNQIVPISRGHLNRLITPFNHPVIHTTSNAKISTQGNIIYVATNQGGPLTMYISPAGNNMIALSLTLLPRPMPPREVELNVVGNKYKYTYVTHEKAKRWETSRPYISTIKKVMRKLALGKVPPGYTLDYWQPGDPKIICAQPGIAVTQGQVLTGANITLLVGVARNLTNKRIEIMEPRCRQPHVLAVAAWPRASLAPGGKTAIYVAISKDRRGPVQTRERPSLLKGGPRGK